MPLPLSEAVARVAGCLGSRILALLDLPKALREEGASRLRSSARHIERNGETYVELDPRWWRKKTLFDHTGTESKPIVGVRPAEGYMFTGFWYFFVSAEDLERLWPGSAPEAAATPPEPPGEEANLLNEKAPPSSQRHRVEIEAEMELRIRDGKVRGLAAYMKDWCEHEDR